MSALTREDCLASSDVAGHNVEKAWSAIKPSSHPCGTWCQGFSEFRFTAARQDEDDERKAEFVDAVVAKRKSV